MSRPRATASVLVLAPTTINLHLLDAHLWTVSEVVSELSKL